jgi:hypothetical protein
MSDSLRVVALISAFNEGDIISSVIGHLVENGAEVYLLDNHSNDDTVDQARQWLGRGLIHIELFPPDAATEPEAATAYDWTAILRRKEELARELGADWYMHHDADEIRESPWPGLSLTEAIGWVDGLGYNCIDYNLFNFRPVDDGFRQGSDPRSYFRLYEEGAEFDRMQLKTWKNTGAPVSLVPSGGHQASFEGRRVFPIPFLLLHYPIRGQTHGTQKVFAERKNRFLEREREQGWHVQYDRFEEETHTFLRDPAELKLFDLDQARLECMLPGNALENLSERLTRIDTELQWRLAQKEDLESSLEAYRLHAANLERDREGLREHIDNIERDRDGDRQHVANLERERREFTQHIANLERDRDGDLQHIANLERERREFTQHIADLERDRDGDLQHIANIERDREDLRQHAMTLESERNALREQVEQMGKTRQELEEQIREFEQVVADMRGSRSWRWTALLRRYGDRSQER